MYPAATHEKNNTTHPPLCVVHSHTIKIFLVKQKECKARLSFIPLHSLPFNIFNSLYYTLDFLKQIKIISILQRTILCAKISQNFNLIPASRHSTPVGYNYKHDI